MQMILIILIRKEECSENDHFLDMDQCQIFRHKMSYIFSIFECSENGPFSEHSSFLIKIIKIIYIYCSLTRNLFYVHLYKCFQVMVQ